MSAVPVSAVEPAAPRRAGRRVLAVIAWIVAVLALVVVGFLVWAHTLFMGERPAALQAWRDDAVQIETVDDGAFVITPADATGEGLVFLPGARVDPAAYLWKLSGVAESTGLTVVVPKVTLNLAFFDTRPISGYTAYAPDVSTWFVGGHSLGGVRGCQLAAGSDAADAGVTGLILFGSYCANDLSDSGYTAVTIAGEFDQLSAVDDIEASAGNLPDDATLVVVDGISHASFGDYGPQPGDGTPTLDSDAARDAISEAVATALGR